MVSHNTIIDEQEEAVQGDYPGGLCGGQDIASQRVRVRPVSYVDQKFLQSYKATVGADFMEK